MKQLPPPPKSVKLRAVPTLMSPPNAHGAHSSAHATCPHCKNSYASDSQYCPACGFPVGSVPRSDADKFIGTTLPAGYHILELIGVGGMGRVYQAEQSVLGRTVAVKIIHPHLLADENSAVRFLTEARAASQLNHPNSISVFDFGRTDDGQPYLVMELLRGKDLGMVAHEEGELPLPRIVDVLRQVLAALGEAHALGIIHRDLKPENIILQPQRRGGDLVKVLDFGLAKLNQQNIPGPSVTSPGIVCGTPDYMAPEQGRGDNIDGRSDLYAVGVILFQLLTGRLPFEGESPTQVVMMHLSVPAPDPRQIAPRRNIPKVIADVVKRALAKKPGDRYADAHEFSDALESALDELEGRSGPREATTGAAPSLISGETLECEACGYQVPRARFCCECAAPLPQDRSAQFPAPFTGRSEELAWLESRRPTTAEVAGARIVGEAGSGKSRLLEEFSQSVSAQGDQIIFVEPDPYGAKVSHYAVAEAIRILGRLTPEQIDTQEIPRASGEVARGLHDVFRGGARGDLRSPMERRHSVAAALRWALVEAATNSPGMPVVILDDMQRMDGPSLHAFSDVLGDPPNVAALIVGAHEAGFECGWGSERTAARMLSGLPSKQVRSLLPSGASLPGNEDVLPLYLDQALRHHFEGGTHIPARMGDLIHQRLDLLDADARRVLQGLSVMGFSSVISDIAELVQIDGIEDAINNLLLRGMVTVTSGRAAVSHPLIRRVTLSAIPAEARRQLHHRALRIEDRKRGPLEARAQHAFACQESFQALLLLEQVADRATAIGDTEAEVLALRQGLEIARREISRGEIDDPMRAVLIFSRKLGASLTRAGDFSDADGILRESLDLAGPTSPDRAKILGALAHVSYGRKRYDEALARLDQAIAAAKKAGSQSLQDTLEETRSAWTR